MAATPVVIITIRLPVDLHEDVRRISFETRMPFNQLVVAALREKLERDTA